MHEFRYVHKWVTPTEKLHEQFVRGSTNLYFDETKFNGSQVYQC